MRYYITYPETDKPDNEFRIVKVLEADEPDFLAERGHQVLASGNNLMEALLRFQQWKAHQEGQ